MATLPKYKTLGLITAHASTGRPTTTAAKYDVAWVNGLAFRNTAKAKGATTALCVTPKGHDPKTSGLHLAPDAARELVTELRTEAARLRGSVDVDNHRAGAPQVWERFSDEDAASLANAISTAVTGH